MGLLVSRSRGFALPTVLIASVILLTVLAVSVTATTSSRTALKTQYYTQMAQIAGEAGVAFAQACLQKSANEPTWDPAGNGSRPLTPGTDCNGDPLPDLSCPSSDTRCWVMVNGNVRTGFTVPRPKVNSSGKAEAISQNGFTQLARTSTETEWRTFNQPAVQSAVPPALCAGAATSALGWNNAFRVNQTSTQSTNFALAIGIGRTSGAVPIGAINSDDNYPGDTYFRKDFNISQPGNYTIYSRADDKVKIYVDGRLVIQTATHANVGSVTLNLAAGCHAIQANVTNDGLVPNTSNFILAMRPQDGTQEVVVTDPSWRVSSGTTVGYSSAEYYMSPSWLPTRDVAAYNAAPWANGPANWIAQSADSAARWSSSNHSFSGTNYPGLKYLHMRTARASAWTLPSATSVRFSIACDDACAVYVNGVQIINKTGGWNSTTSVTYTVPAGHNSVGIQLFNDNAAANGSGVLFSARRVSDNSIIDRTDSAASSWYSTNEWYDEVQTLRSYPQTFRPDPDTYSCNCPNQGTTNTVKNPSFETNTTGVSSTESTFTRTGLAAYAGTFGLRGTSNAVATMPRITNESTDFETGQIYNISAAIRSSQNVRVGYQLADSQGQGITVNGSNFFLGTAVAGGGVWKRPSIVTVPIPPGTAKIIVWAGLTSAAPSGTVFDVDGMMMSPGPNSYYYGDGSLSTWMWTGTSNASVSSGPASSLIPDDFVFTPY